MKEGLDRRLQTSSLARSLTRSLVLREGLEDVSGLEGGQGAGVGGGGGAVVETRCAASSVHDEPFGEYVGEARGERFVVDDDAFRVDTLHVGVVAYDHESGAWVSAGGKEAGFGDVQLFGGADDGA